MIIAFTGDIMFLFVGDIYNNSGFGDTYWVREAPAGIVVWEPRRLLFFCWGGEAIDLRFSAWRNFEDSGELPRSSWERGETADEFPETESPSSLPLLLSSSGCRFGRFMRP